MSSPLPKQSTIGLMQRLVRGYVRPYFGTMGLALVFMVISAAMTAAVAKLMQPILDDVLSKGDTGLVLPVAFAALAVFVVNGAATYLHTTLMNKVSHSIIADIQTHLFKHFMALDLAFFHANPSGQLISRVINDVTSLRAAVSDALMGVGKNFLTLLFLVIVMFHQDVTLSLAAFGVVPFIAGFIAYLGRRLRGISRSIQFGMAGLSDRLSQIFQGIRQVKAYGMETHETLRASAAIEQVKRFNIKSVRVGALSGPVNEVMAGFVFFGIIIYGGYKTSAGEMTTGELGSFLTAFMLAYEPMKKLAKLNNTLQTGLGAAERVFEMLDLSPSIVDAPGAKELQATKPDLAFDDVSFQYDAGDAPALRGVSFRAEGGKVTALVGPSGGGKSTVLNLIPRFYDVSGGVVTVDGQDIRNFTVESLRRNIALVSQDITIFDESIEANIAYGRLDASPEDIREAAAMAAAHEFISEFPQGYETRVGEDGVKLSGGQRQRIAIARAILRDAPILLLDEATSALDNESEKLVQEALKLLEKGRTTIVIAHRLSTVREADQIIVLDEGAISEVGTHEELLASGALYAKMYETGLKE